MRALLRRAKLKSHTAQPVRFRTSAISARQRSISLSVRRFSSAQELATTATSLGTSSPKDRISPTRIVTLSERCSAARRYASANHFLGEIDRDDPRVWAMLRKNRRYTASRRPQVDHLAALWQQAADGRRAYLIHRTHRPSGLAASVILGLQLLDLHDLVIHRHRHARALLPCEAVTHRAAEEDITAKLHERNLFELPPRLRRKVSVAALDRVPMALLQCSPKR